MQKQPSIGFLKKRYYGFFLFKKKKRKKAQKNKNLKLGKVIEKTSSFQILRYKKKFDLRDKTSYSLRILKSIIRN